MGGELALLTLDGGGSPPIPPHIGKPCDVKWEDMLTMLRIDIELNCRYMDDGRTWLYPIKEGWRLIDGKLKFSGRWKMEDSNIGEEERTKKIMLGTQNMVEDYLKFTAEVPGEFEGGWLPTLDTSLKITEDNCTLFKYYEKENSSKKTV